MLTGLRQVVELEISLDETQEQYKNVLKNSNSKAQQRKMDFLSRNLEQLTQVQKQVRPRCRPSPLVCAILTYHHSYFAARRTKLFPQERRRHCRT